MAFVPANSADPSVPAVGCENTARGAGVVGTISSSRFLWFFRMVVSVIMLLAVCGAPGANLGVEAALAASAQAPTNTGALLFYEATSGGGATARLDGTGKYTYVGSLSGFSTQWTHVVATAGGGVLFYDASTGNGATARLDNAGKYTYVG